MNLLLIFFNELSTVLEVMYWIPLVVFWTPAFPLYLVLRRKATALLEDLFVQNSINFIDVCLRFNRPRLLRNWAFIRVRPRGQCWL